MAEKKDIEKIDEPDAIGVNITKHTTQGEVDTFDHILEVTSHHEAVYAYYYMDENNKVRLIPVDIVLPRNSIFTTITIFYFCF